MSGCQTCGTAAALDARFCSRCGARLGDPAATIQPDIRNKVLTTLRAEHRLVTVVFADMTGSVRRTRDLDAEGATALVNPLLETMVELMVQYGGRIDRFLGDGLLAVFGVPAAHEDDPIRAIRAALALREQAAELGLGVTIGVNTGRVYFGPVGSSLHEELTVMGPVVNLAARLQGAASDGEVLVGAATREHIHATFDLSPRTLTIKGMDDPVEVYLVRRFAADPDKVRGIEGLTSDLIGRDVELAELDAALQTTTTAVVGEAGLGKSRLLREYRARTDRIWLEGRCQLLTSSVPFSGFIDLVLRAAGGSDPALIRAGLERLPTLERADIEEILPYLVHMVGRSFGDERDLVVTQTEPSQRSLLTIDAIRRWLSAVADRGPVLVFIDDLHWADELTVEAVASLAGEDRRLAVAVASRPEPTMPLEALSDATPDLREIRLHALRPEQTTEMIRQLLTISGLPDETQKRLADWARGNPFYVEELLRSLIQREMIVQRDGHWYPGPVPAALELPESIDALVMSRFDRLPTTTRRVGQMAAVLDRPFAADLVSAVLGADVAPSLTELAQSGFLVTAEETWAFSHDLVREALYQTLLPSQRLELHGRTGDAIRRFAPDDHESQAFHFERSSNHQAAVTELIAVAQRAFSAYANEAAADHIDRGLLRVAALGEGEQHAPMAAFLLLRAQLRERASSYTEALADLDAAAELVEPASRAAAEIHRVSARVHRMRDEYSEAFTALDAAEALIDPSERPRAWIELQEERSQALYFGGRGRELPDLIERVRPVVDTHGTSAQRAELLGLMAFHLFIVSRFKLDDDAVELCRRALDLSKSGDPGRLATARFRLGFCLLWADRSGDAIPELERSLGEARRVGDVMLENRALSYLSIALRRVDDVARARTTADMARALALQVGDSYYVGHAEAVLGWCDLRAGDLESAKTHLVTAIEQWGWIEQRGSRGANVEFGWLAAWPLAAAAVEQGDPATAARHLALITTPWERPMSPELESAVSAAVSDPTMATLNEALALARRERLR